MEDKKNNILSSILSINDFNKDYNPENNISVNFLTIYEKTQILGLRKEQISGGAETTLDDNEIPYVGAPENTVFVAGTYVDAVSVPDFIAGTAVTTGSTPYYAAPPTGNNLYKHMVKTENPAPVDAE